MRRSEPIEGREAKKSFDTILVLDFGGQYSHLIARRVREQHVFSEIVPFDVTLKEIENLAPKGKVKGIILSGGPSSVYMENAPKIDNGILTLNLPILGVCYGHQLLAHLSQGIVRYGEKQEYGITYITVDKPVGILKDLGSTEKVWMSHGDVVYLLPEEYEILAHTNICPIAAFRHKERPVYGVQWHPEVVHTENGTKMLQNFIFNVCKCQSTWKTTELKESLTHEITQIVGNDLAITGLSGGIDSSTATILAKMALGNNLIAVFVDHGFMREGEPEFVESTFTQLGVNLISVKAQTRFMKKLKGITDPEMKRQMIGNEFIRVFEEVARKTKSKFLIQGTIYPDRIESGVRRHSEKIKTHHNVAGIPADIEFQAIVEPLKDLYKDEVRQLAKSLELPPELIWRQPFPGPGLAVRVIGEVTAEKINIVKSADKIVAEEIEKMGLRDNLWQYFAVLTGTKTTGVKGDSRAYGYTIALRAVESTEAMTASFARIPFDVLERISTRITNELPSVTRIVYDITHKPPATIEWE